MINLYYWPTPNGWKITILLHELGQDYVLIPVNLRTGAQFDPDFLAISPNNRIPAIVDHDPADGGPPISVFESGAIMMYLAEKHGRFWPRDVRGRYEVSQWLMWQMAGLGPMAAQAHHFRDYAPAPIAYAIDRYTDEANRLYGVMNIRLKDREFLAGDYSIADMACWVWVRTRKGQGQDLDDFPHLKRWYETVAARPAAHTGSRVGVDLLGGQPTMTEDARKVLLGQRARPA